MKKPTLIDKGAFEGLFRPESKALDIYSVELVKFDSSSAPFKNSTFIESIPMKTAAAAVEYMDIKCANSSGAPFRHATHEERVMTTASEDGNAPPGARKAA